MNEKDYLNRYSDLPNYRRRLMENLEKDLIADDNIKAIFYGGSIGENNTDLFSDIDVRIIVNRKNIQSYRENKKKRAETWGNVLYFEGYEYHNFTIAHYDTFNKIDIFYYSEDEIEPSIWLKKLKIVYDPYHVISDIKKQSMHLYYHFDQEDVLAWRTKIFAYIHEAFRRALRKEYYYAIKCVDNLRLSIVTAWYMEKNVQPNSFGDWAKVEGCRSILDESQLRLLKNWQSVRSFEDTLNVIKSMRKEFERLNLVLSKKVNISPEERLIEKVFEKVFY